jgi:Putative Flp pilus-assembly TadE/G-like
MYTAVSKLIVSCRRFWQERDGGVLVYFAIALPVLLGVSGLAVDISSWYGTRRSAQAAADAAAVAMAYESVRTGDPGTMLLAATDAAEDNGYEASKGDEITLNSPPTSGAFAGSSTEFEAIVQRNVPGFLSRILIPGDVTVAARAVATTGLPPGPGDGCLWTLAPTGSGALTVTGNADINIGCGIFVNSNDDTALDQGGASCVNASSVSVVGGASGSCLNPDAVEGFRARRDPMASMRASVSPGLADIPSTSGCDSSDHIAKNKKTVVLDPGCFSGNISASPGGTLVFNPGIYTLDNASLDFKGNVEGNGVSFYVTENSNQPISINSQANVNLVAGGEAYGPMAGVLFYQDPNSVGGIEHMINGGADLYMEGIVYFPKDDFTFNGGSSANQSPTYLIANRVKFAGGTEFGNYEGSAGQSNPYLGSGARVTLVE